MSIGDFEWAPAEESCRRNTERRAHSIPSILFNGRSGNRRGGRRVSDRAGFYVDWYHPHLFFVALGILMLSALDATLTLILIHHGGSEINPVMAVLIEHDVQWFINIKLLLTTLGVIFLVTHCHFRLLKYIKVSHILYFCLASYASLISYECVLLSRVVAA